MSTPDISDLPSRVAGPQCVFIFKVGSTVIIVRLYFKGRYVDDIEKIIIIISQLEHSLSVIL